MQEEEEEEDDDAPPFFGFAHSTPRFLCASSRT